MFTNSGRPKRTAVAIFCFLRSFFRLHPLHPLSPTDFSYHFRFPSLFHFSLLFIDRFPYFILQPQHSFCLFFPLLFSLTLWLRFCFRLRSPSPPTNQSCNCHKAHLVTLLYKVLSHQNFVLSLFHCAVPKFRSSEVPKLQERKKHKKKSALQNGGPRKKKTHPAENSSVFLSPFREESPF